jgi:hypothetical protein
VRGGWSDDHVQFERLLIAESELLGIARSLVFPIFSRGIDRYERRTWRREGGTFVWPVCSHVGRSVSCRREVLAVRGVGKEYMSKRQGYLLLPPLHLTLHLTLHAVTHHPVRVVVLVATISPGNLLDGLRADALGCRHRAVLVGKQ